MWFIGFLVCFGAGRGFGAGWIFDAVAVKPKTDVTVRIKIDIEQNNTIATASNCKLIIYYAMSVRSQ